jgi:hypothetical protein
VPSGQVKEEAGYEPANRSTVQAVENCELQVPPRKDSVLNHNICRGINKKLTKVKTEEMMRSAHEQA